MVNVFVDSASSDDKEVLPTICQINVEFHFPPSDYDSSFEYFFAAFSKLIMDQLYVLMYVDRHEQFDFLRFFFVNIQDDRCVKKFHC